MWLFRRERKHVRHAEHAVSGGWEAVLMYPIPGQKIRGDRTRMPECSAQDPTVLNDSGARTTTPRTDHLRNPLSINGEYYVIYLPEHLQMGIFTKFTVVGTVFMN